VAQIYTIGHSSHPFPRFLELLEQHGIRLVADVRSVPYSRHHPQYRREPLAAGLEKAGIAYEFLGRELGARAEDPGVYAEGRVQYDRLARTAPFRAGIERVKTLGSAGRVALLCAEREPLDCHRSVLIAPVLEREGFPVIHVLADGTQRTQGEAVQRLVEEAGLGAGDLFTSQEDLVKEALKRREERIAWRAPRPD
jgi:uncharacterized protein (DUF488 family)